MEMKKNDQSFQSMISSITLEGTHILRHEKKNKKNCILYQVLYLPNLDSIALLALLFHSISSIVFHRISLINSFFFLIVQDKT